MSRTKVRNVTIIPGVKGTYGGNMSPLVRFLISNHIKKEIGMSGRKLGSKVVTRNTPKPKKPMVSKSKKASKGIRL